MRRLIDRTRAKGADDAQATAPERARFALSGRQWAIAALALAASGLGALQYFYLTPTKEEVAARVLALEGAIAGARQETERVRDDIAFLGDNAERFAALQMRGVFAEPDPVRAARALEAVAGARPLTSFEYTFQPPTRAEHERRFGPIDKFDATLSLRMEGALDASLWEALDAVVAALPSLARIENFALERLERPDPDNLARLAAGEPVAFAGVEASILLRALVDRPPPGAPGGRER